MLRREGLGDRSEHAGVKRRGEGGGGLTTADRWAGIEIDGRFRETVVRHPLNCMHAGGGLLRVLPLV